MAKVVIISASLRKDSFSEELAHCFEKGASEAGNDVRFISLKGKDIGYCTGCNCCQKTKKCVIRDDSNEIVEAIRTSEVVAWFTPIYYYNMSGQMKTLIDRANSLYVSEYSTRDVYLVTTCADTDPDAIEGTLKGVEGWVQCLPGTRIAGTFCATGLPNDASLDDSDFRQKVYRMGRNI